MTVDIFDKPEKKILEYFIKGEIEKQSFDPALELPFVQARRLAFTIAAAAATFILLLLYFRTGVLWVIPVELVTIGLYLWLMIRSNATNCIMRKMKARPDEELSLIVSELLTGITGNKYKFLLYLSIFALSITIPLAAYWHPKMDFSLEESGYYLSCYTRSVVPESVVYIPESHFGTPVVGIKGNAFSHIRRVHEVIIPESVTDIRGDAFQNCFGLVKVNIPTGVTEIGEKTFQNCRALKEIIIPGGVTRIAAYAFDNCKSLVKVNIPTGVTEIRGNTFQNCRALKEIIIPGGVTRIAAYAFYNCCSLSEVTVPASVEEIGSSAFRSCDHLTVAYIAKGTEVNERSFKESPTKINFY